MKQESKKTLEAKGVSVYVVSVTPQSDGSNEIDSDIESIKDKFNDRAVLALLSKGRDIRIRTFRNVDRDTQSIEFDKLYVREVAREGYNSSSKALIAVEPVDGCEQSGSDMFKDYQRAVMKRHFGNDVPLPCDNCKCKNLKTKDFKW
jgi:hypothetical protein